MKKLGNYCILWRIAELFFNIALYANKMNKSALREIYLSKQRSISATMRAQKSKAAVYNFFRNFDFSGINVLHCFISIEKFNEIDTKPLLQRIWEEFPQIITVVPRINFKTGEMQNLKFAAATDLVPNIWNIYEPSHDELVETEKIDMVLVPLLCFDERGYRVGYGKGFYDKFLSRCRIDCVKIGFSYFEPVEEIQDVSEFDVTLDFFITPDDILETRGKRDAETQ